MHPNAKDISGYKFNRLTAIEPIESLKNRGILWRCICDCGKETFVPAGELKSNHTKSCGCYKLDILKKRNKEILSKHGMARTSEYKAWNAMKTRCKPNAHCRNNYYDRGIRVCDEWSKKDGFIKFFDCVGFKPNSLCSLDRIDNDKGYEPNNVRWASSKEQNSNKRKSKSLSKFTNDELLNEIKKRELIK